MTNKSIPFSSLSPDNASGMDRDWTGIASAFPRKLFALLFCLQLIGVGNVWAGTSTKTEGFQTASTITTYNGTRTLTTSDSDCGIAWSIYYGNVSTTSAITGNSCLMRYYSSSSSNLGYAKTTTAIKGLTNVTFNAKVTKTDVKMGVWYSTDGSSWTAIATGVALTTSSASKSYNIPSSNPATNYYIKIGITAASTDKKDLIIDDIVFTYTTYTVTYDGNGKTSGSVPTDATKYLSGETVTVKSNSGSLAKTGYTFSGWNTQADGNGTNYTAGSGTFTITSDKTLYAKWVPDISCANPVAPTNSSFFGTGLFVPLSPGKYRAEEL